MYSQYSSVSIILLLLYCHLAKSQTISLYISDTLPLRGALYPLQPVCPGPEQVDGLRPLCYRVDTSVLQQPVTGKQLGLGTHFFATVRPLADRLCSTQPVYAAFPGIIQVTVWRDSTYLGYLEELLCLPFVMPPRRISSHGHQTDLRLGTDCAELAIYGRRRQGYPIPYSGPKGILQYLESTNRLERGVILHFGHQVSVLYEDRGVPGTLDAPDLLLHAYTNQVEIVTIGETDLLRQHCKWYCWKN